MDGNCDMIGSPLLTHAIMYTRISVTTVNLYWTVTQELETHPSFRVNYI